MKTVMKLKTLPSRDLECPGCGGAVHTDLLIGATFEMPIHGTPGDGEVCPAVGRKFRVMGTAAERLELQTLRQRQQERAALRRLYRENGQWQRLQAERLYWRSIRRVAKYGRARIWSEKGVVVPVYVREFGDLSGSALRAVRFSSIYQTTVSASMAEDLNHVRRRARVAAKGPCKKDRETCPRGHRR